MKQKKLEIFLQQVPPHPAPIPHLEQYITPATIAADILFTAFHLQDIKKRHLADYGCGTGIFAIGAGLLGANKVYALLRSFAATNYIRFHDIAGVGYKFIADEVIKLDKINPQVGARLVEPLIHWRKFDEARQNLMKAELERILQQPNLSKNIYEIVSKGVKS